MLDVFADFMAYCFFIFSMIYVLDCSFFFFHPPLLAQKKEQADSQLLLYIRRLRRSIKQAD